MVAVGGIAAVVALAVFAGRPGNDTSVPVQGPVDDRNAARVIDAEVSPADSRRVNRGQGGAAPGRPRQAARSGNGSTERRSHGDPEDVMEADELLRAAIEAYDSNEPAVAYRRAAKSHAKEPTEAALEIKAKAACQMKNEDAARAALSDLPRSRKRTVRKACRSAGVWLSAG